jgi:hypothetical protein
MTRTDAGAGTARFNSLAGWAGYLGVLPLVACLAGVGLLPEYAARELAQRIALAWGAAALASAGAVHWGLALGGRLSWDLTRTGCALAPAILATLAVVLGGQHGLAVLVIGTGGFWLYEHRVLGPELPPGYLDRRRPLALASCMLLALTMFVSDSAGLP